MSDSRADLYDPDDQRTWSKSARQHANRMAAQRRDIEYMGGGCDDDEKEEEERRWTKEDEADARYHRKKED